MKLTKVLLESRYLKRTNTCHQTNEYAVDNSRETLPEEIYIESLKYQLSILKQCFFSLSSLSSHIVFSSREHNSNIFQSGMTFSILCKSKQNKWSMSTVHVVFSFFILFCFLFAVLLEIQFYFLQNKQNKNGKTNDWNLWNESFEKFNFGANGVIFTRLPLCCCQLLVEINQNYSVSIQLWEKPFSYSEVIVFCGSIPHSIQPFS